MSTSETLSTTKHIISTTEPAVTMSSFLTETTETVQTTSTMTSDSCGTDISSAVTPALTTLTPESVSAVEDNSETEYDDIEYSDTDYELPTGEVPGVEDSSSSDYSEWIPGNENGALHYNKR